MTMPLDLILVRHGQSEANAAKRLSEKGDHSAFSSAFRERHTSNFRLTEKGRGQAQQAGVFLKTEFLQKGMGFDRYITSDYARAIETAALLGLPDARWFCDPYLTERDWGDLEICPEDERQEKFGDALRRRDKEPFFWRPPNGESFTDLCIRVDRALDTLHRECGDRRVIIVCHGEVMRAFQVRIERISQGEFKRLVSSNEPEDRIHNCQINHYTRRDPVTKSLNRYISHVRRLRPAETNGVQCDWQQITRRPYSNTDLHEMLLRHPPLSVDV